MDLDKYTELRTKISGKDYENKYKGVRAWLTRSSYFGNAGSIFFAYFLLFPFLFKAATIQIGDAGWVLPICVIISIFTLGLFEFLKREVVKIFSNDFIKRNMKIKSGNTLMLVFVLGLMAGSMGLSLNGAIEFSSTSNKENVVIVDDVKSKIDSLNLLYENKKIPYLDDNENLRKASTDARTKMNELPSNYITTRERYNNIIKDNQKAIEDNNSQVENLSIELNHKISNLKEEQIEQTTKNEEEDSGLIILFFSLSFAIELIIIIGVFYKEYYDYKSFKENEPKLEPMFIKMNRNRIMIDIIYDKGNIGPNEPITSVNKMKQLLKSRGHLFLDRQVKDFYSEMKHRKILETIGNRTYSKVTYTEAINKICEGDY